MEIYWENDFQDIYGLRDFNISINLVPYGELVGVRNGLSADGKIQFTGLVAKNSGIFQVQASGAEIITNTSLEFTVIDTDKVSSIELSSEVGSLREGEFISIDAILYDYYGDAIVYNTTVYLFTFSQDFEGNSSALTDQGRATFEIKLNTIGSFEFQAYSLNDSADVSVSKLTIYVTDKLCEDLNPDYTCKTCKSDSEMLSGSCECKATSYYTANTCQCLAGYLKKSGECKKCGNYFAPHMLEGSISNDLLSITIIFASSILESGKINCGKAIKLPSSLSDYNFECYWLNSYSFKLLTTKKLVLPSFTIKVLPGLTPSPELCIEEEEELVLKVRLTSKFKFESIEIIAPESFSVYCSSESLLISAYPLKAEYNYEWATLLNNHVNTTYTTYSVLIPNSLLAEGYLEIFLKVTSSLSSSSVNQYKNITVTNSPCIYVQFNLPNILHIKASDDLNIKASSFDSCSSDTEKFDYKWQYLSGGELGFEDMLKNSLRKESVFIPGYTLLVDNTYEFKVTASRNGVTGTAYLTVYVDPAEVEISFDIWSGVVSINKDLIINSKIIDPNWPSSSIFYEWTCTQDGKTCKNEKNEDLISAKDHSWIKIKNTNLVLDSSYSFKLVVTTYKISSEKEIEITVQGNFTGILNLPTISRQLSSSKSLFIVPNLSTTENYKFKWSFSPQLPDPWATEHSNLYFHLPKYQLENGQVYLISLTIQDSDNENFVFSSFIEVPAAPNCENFKATQIDPVWLLEIENCVSDYLPITYEYGVLYDNGRFDKFTFKTSNPQYKMTLKDSENRVFVHVCNDYNCQVYIQRVENASSSRQLSSLDDVKKMIKNPEDVLTAIYLYGDLLNSTEYEYLSENLLALFQTEQFDSNVFFMFLEKMEIVLLRNNSVSTEVFHDYMDLLLGSLEKYQFTLSYNQMLVLLTSIENYVIKNSTVYNLDLLDKLAFYYLNYSIPSTEVVYSGEYFIYIQRLMGAELESLSLDFGDFFIVLPTNISINKVAIYDLVIIKINSTNEVISIKVYNVGLAEGYNLIYTERLDDTLQVASPGKVTLNYEIDNSYHYKCYVLDSDDSWVDDGCDIQALDSNMTEAEFDQFCVFSIKNLGKKCPFNFYPLVALGAIIIVQLILVIRINRKDQDMKAKLKPRSYFTLHPLMSLLISQRYRIRVNILLQMFSNTLLLFALIGFLHNFLAAPLRPSYNAYEAFLNSHVEIGAIAFGVTQVYTIPFYLATTLAPFTNLNFWILNSFRILVTCPSLAGVVWMSINYCGQYTFRWLINFVIFCPMQIVFLEAIYAFLVEIFLKEDRGRFKSIASIGSNKIGFESNDELDSLNNAGRSASATNPGYLFKVYKEEIVNK